MSKKKSINTTEDGEQIPSITLTTEEEIAKLFRFIKKRFYPSLELFDEAIFVGTVLEHVAAENTLNALNADAVALGHEDHSALEQSKRDESAREITADYLSPKGEPVHLFADEQEMKIKNAYAHTQGFENFKAFDAKQHEIKLAQEKARL